MKRSLLGLALMASVLGADAQPMLVKDINPGTGNSFPCRLTANGKKLVFAADDGTNGSELWMMDTSGTNLAFNINPAAASGVTYNTNRPMAIVGKYMYFPANNGTSGTELYRWDGTNPPALAAEIYAGASGSNVDEVIAMNGKIYFDATDGTYGEELWAYDTMTNMASRLTDITVGAGGSFIQSMVVYNGKLYFNGYIAATGQELYCYDPATNSTTLVLDIDAGVNSSNPNNMIVINGKLYFTASTVANGRELYSYNGTNVTRLTDVVTGTSNGINNTAIGVSMIIGMGNAVYFSGNESTTSTGHLYKYDPATGITSLVYKINPTGNSNITNLTAYPGRIIMQANNGTLGAELWQYTGTGIPTMIADIRSGVNSSSPSEFCLIGSTVYFQATDSANGTELYKYRDTTLTGVQNVAFRGDVKVYPNPATSNVTFDMNLENSQSLNLNIIDMTGRVVYNSGMKLYAAGNNRLNVSVDGLANGMYIFSLRDENGRMMMSGQLQKQ